MIVEYVALKAYFKAARVYGAPQIYRQSHSPFSTWHTKWVAMGWPIGA
jgi:hypothetical protein